MVLEGVRLRQIVDYGSFEAEWGAWSEHRRHIPLIEHLVAIISSHGTYIWLVAVDEIQLGSKILRFRLMMILWLSTHRHHLKRHSLEARLLRCEWHAKEPQSSLTLGLVLHECRRGRLLSNRKGLKSRL